MLYGTSYALIDTNDIRTYFVLAWSEGRGNDFSVLRLIYQGRFLHGNTTLNGECCMY